MSISGDITFWAVCVNAGITMLGFAIIKFNDFSHLEKDVKEIKENVDILATKVIKLDKKQAVQEQKIKTLEKDKK